MAVRNDYYSEMTTTELFKLAERRLKDKRQFVEDVKNECQLLEKQAFDLYKSYIDYTWLMLVGSIEKARNWFRMLSSNQDMDGNKLDKRKKYDEKISFDVFTKRLQKCLDVPDLKIVKITDFNFTQAWNIDFKAHGHDWMIQIPVVQNIRLESYQRYGSNCFQLSLYERGDNVITQIGATFEEDELKDLMAKGIEEYC